MEYGMRGRESMRNENKEGHEGWIEIGTLKMKRGKSKKNESCIMNRGEEEMRRADEKKVEDEDDLRNKR